MSDDDKPLFDPSDLGSLGNLMGNLMGQVQQMQSNIGEMRDRVREKTVEGRAGGGIVTVTANGASEILRISIDPVAVDPRDVPMLEDLVAAATNDALTQARELMKSEMATATGGIPIPGLSDLL
jgi:nucleoid-associated protein EbfC